MVKPNAATSSLSGDSSSLKVGYFSFGSSVSVSTVSKPIFDIKDTGDNSKITTPMLSGSGKNIKFFCCLDASASPKSSGGGFSDYSSTIGSGGF